MKAETPLQSKTLLTLSDAGLMVFRNTVGRGPVAPPSRRVTARRKQRVEMNPGDVLLRRPSYLSWGLAPGSSDIIGMTPVVITDEMVGRTLAVFTGVEVKTPTGPERKDQKTFRLAVNEFGGIVRVIRSVEEARRFAEIARQHGRFQ